MPTATLSIHRTPMALPSSRGLDSTQRQVQRKSEERAGSSSVYMWGNSEWPRGKNQQPFSFVLHWQGRRSHWPNGGPGRRDSGQSFKKSPALPYPTPPLQPFFPPRLTEEDLKSFHTLEIYFLYNSDLCLFLFEGSFLRIL